MFKIYVYVFMFLGMIRWIEVLEIGPIGSFIFGILVSSLVALNEMIKFLEKIN